MVKKYHPYYGSQSAGNGATVNLCQPTSESSPLLRQGILHGRTYSLRQLGVFVVALCLLLTSYPAAIHFLKCPPDPATRDAIRQDWEIEKAHHNNLKREWELKRQEEVEKENDWRRKAVQHEREVAQRIREEHERHEQTRQEWLRETEHHVREFEELMSRERQQREVERERWRSEVAERDKREAEERQRRHMFWGHVEVHPCTTYATREYTARLMNLPTTWQHRLDACKATPMEIHGVSYLPTTCEDKGPGFVIGRWKINQNEPECTTFWDSYDNKGCTSPGSGKRRITQKLMDLPEHANWKEFCASTPTQLNHLNYPGAQSCFTAVWGVYGQWELDDGSC